MQDPQTGNSPNRPKPRGTKATIIMVAVCAGAVILGIFVGVIVLYGGSQSL